MVAQTLSICIPDKGCNQNCPYCVSKMTWNPLPDETQMYASIHKVKSFAERAGVTDVVLTGKGEPTLNYEFISKIMPHFKEWPVVLQTNGTMFTENISHKLRDYHIIGTDIVAVSVDDLPILTHYSKIGMFKYMKSNHLIPRITVMLTPYAVRNCFEDWIDECLNIGIRQLSFREVTIPNYRMDTTLSNEAALWIEKNITTNFNVNKWIKNYYKEIKQYSTIRQLPYGAVIKDVRGISVTYFEYCVQDTHRNDDIRSLIWNQDGHLYTTWNSPASLIF